MSTTVELGKATAEIARLRAGMERLAAEWAASDLGTDRYCAADLRALLDES